MPPPTPYEQLLLGWCVGITLWLLLLEYRRWRFRRGVNESFGSVSRDVRKLDKRTKETW